MSDGTQPTGQPKKIVVNDVTGAPLSSPAPIAQTPVSPMVAPEAAAPVEQPMAEPVAVASPPAEIIEPSPSQPTPAPAGVPKFGELQPKVDSHPLFSGAKEPKPKNPRRWLKRTIAPVITLVIAAVLLYLAMDAGLVKGYSHLPFHFFKSPVATTTVPAITPAKTATTTPAVDPYAGWKTYTLKYEKLTLKYPSTWTVQDTSGNPGLTTNADTVILTASDGYRFNIDDGWDGGGDSLNLATDSPVPVTFLGTKAYIVCGHPRFAVLEGKDPNSVSCGTLMTNPSSAYDQTNIANYFPQDKYAHGDPKINNGGSTMLIDGGYSTPKYYSTVAQAQNDPEFKNFVLVLQSMHY